MKVGSFLDDLEGEERDINIPKDSDIENLMKTFESWSDNTLIDDHESFGPHYFKLIELIENNLINKNTINEFVSVYLNNDFENKKQEMLGIFTGAMLDIYTKKFQDDIYINGHNNYFNYLFHHAKNINTLILDNFKGDNILRKAGTENINNLIIANSNLKECCNYIGQKGKINNLILLNNTIERGFYYAFNSGAINNLIIANCNIDDFGEQIGYNSKINLFLNLNCIINDSFGELGLNAEINNASFINSRVAGSLFMACCGSNPDKTDINNDYIKMGNINVMLANSVGYNVLCESYINKLILYKAHFSDKDEDNPYGSDKVNNFNDNLHANFISNEPDSEIDYDIIIQNMHDLINFTKSKYNKKFEYDDIIKVKDLVEAL
ncbi:hypothetical protein ACFL1H_05480 [Nanoarchaeota archaeon]